MQLVYTCLALLPVALFWSFFHMHLVYLVCIYLVCVWNGSNYYIEVFSKAYRKQFEGDAAARATAARMLMEAPPPRTSTSQDRLANASESAETADAGDGCSGAGAGKKVD